MAEVRTGPSRTATGTTRLTTEVAVGTPPSGGALAKNLAGGFRADSNARMGGMDTPIDPDQTYTVRFGRSQVFESDDGGATFEDLGEEPVTHELGVTGRQILEWGPAAKADVHVRRSYVLGREDTPKSGKVRSVPLIDQAARALDALSRREQFTADDDRVFADAAGSVLSGDALRIRYRGARDRAGLKPLRFHDLRHTFGTLAVQAFPLSDVKAYMGHANIETTMLYVHHVPQHDAADKLSALVTAAEDVHPTVHRTGVMRPQLSATQ
jgi:hypothetical protein